MSKQNPEFLSWAKSVIKHIQDANHSELEKAIYEGLTKKYPLNFTLSDKKKNLLHVAVEKGNLVATKLILTKEIELLFKLDVDGKTPLDYAKKAVTSSGLPIPTVQAKLKSNIRDCLVYLQLKESEMKRLKDNQAAAAADSDSEDSPQVNDTETQLSSEVYKLSTHKASVEVALEDRIKDLALGKLTAKQRTTIINQTEKEIERNLKQFVFLRIEKRNDEVFYVMKFGDTIRPFTEHGKAQYHHISAYALMTEAIAKSLDGKDPESATEILLRQVIKYAPSSVKDFEEKIKEYNSSYDVFQKPQRDLIALADKRNLDFLRSLQEVEFPTAELQEQFARTLLLAEERQKLADHVQIKNKIKAGDNLEKFSGLVSLISKAVLLMNLEHDITFNDGTKPLGRGEGAAKAKLEEGMEASASSAKLFDYPAALLKDKGEEHYRSKVVKHLSLIKDAYPKLVIDDKFVRRFLNEDGAEKLFTKKDEVISIAKDVNDFEKKCLEDYKKKTAIGTTPSAPEFSQLTKSATSTRGRK